MIAFVWHGNHGINLAHVERIEHRPEKDQFFIRLASGQELTFVGEEAKQIRAVMALEWRNDFKTRPRALFDGGEDEI